MNEVLHRISELLKDRGMSENAFTKEIGIPQSTYNTWVQRDGVPSAKWLPKIADHLDVSVDYLLKGELEDLQYINDEIRGVVQKYYESVEMKMLVKAIKDLSPDDMKKITNIIKAYKGE